MKKIAITLLLSAVISPALASNFYAGIRAGQATTSIENNTYNNSTLTSTNPAGWGILVGHDFNANLAVEFEYLNLGEIKAGTGSAKSTGFSFSGIGSFPINPQYSLFGKVGYADITGVPGGTFTGLQAKSSAITYGFGIQYNFNPALALRAGWDKYKFNDSGLNGNASLLSAGALFRF